MREARLKSKQALSIAQRKQARAEERKLRREWEAEKALQRLKKGKKANDTTSLMVGGRLNVDRSEWRSELDRHVHNRYVSLPPDRGSEAELLQLLRGHAEAASEFGDEGPTISYNQVMEARATMTDGKASGPGLVVVAEMLKALPMMVTVVIWHLMSRIMETANEVLPPTRWWKSMVLIFIAQSADACSLTKHRGIALLSLLAK